MRSRSKSLLTWSVAVVALFACTMHVQAEGDARRGVVVVPAPYYTPETSAAVAVSTIYHFASPAAQTRPSQISASLTGTANRQWAARIATELCLAERGLDVDGELEFRHFPSTFFGVGGDVDESAEEDYSYRGFSIAIGPRRRIGDHWSIGPRLEMESYDLSDVEEAPLLSSGAIAGSEGGMVAAAGVVARFDSRDNVFFPQRGTYATAAAMSADGAIGSDYDFHSFALDLRHYRTVGGVVLATNATARATRGDVPFHRLSLLGGAQQMRGYYEGRYRDHDLAVVQAEARKMLSAKLGVAAFASAGGVGPTLGAIEQVKASGGFGMRWRVGRDQPINVRADVGVGTDGMQIYLALLEAF